MKKLLINAFLGAACLLSCADTSGMNIALQAIKNNDINGLQLAISRNNISLKNEQNFTDFVEKAISVGASHILRYLMTNAPLDYFAPKGEQFFDLLNLALRSGDTEIVQLICNNYAENVVPQMAKQFGWEEVIDSVFCSNNKDLIQYIGELVRDSCKGNLKRKQFFHLLNMTLKYGNVEILQLICNDDANSETIISKKARDAIFWMVNRFEYKEIIDSVFYSNNKDLIQCIGELVRDSCKGDFKRKRFFYLLDRTLEYGNVEILQLICNNNVKTIIPETAKQSRWEKVILSVLQSNNVDLIRLIFELAPNNFEGNFDDCYYPFGAFMHKINYNTMERLWQDKLFDQVGLNNPKYITQMIVMQMDTLENPQEEEDTDRLNQSQSDEDKKAKKEEDKKKMLLLISCLRNNSNIQQYDELKNILSESCDFFSKRRRFLGRVFFLDVIDDDIDIRILTTMIYAFEGEPLFSFLSWMTDAYLQQNFTRIFEYACQRHWTRAIMNLLQLRKEGVKGVDGVQLNAGLWLSCLVDKQEEEDKRSEEISSIIADIISMPNVDLNGKYEGKTVIERAVSGGNIELVKLILTNPRVNVLRALDLCKPGSNMWQLLNEYKEHHPEF